MPTLWLSQRISQRSFPDEREGLSRLVFAKRCLSSFRYSVSRKSSAAGRTPNVEIASSNATLPCLSPASCERGEWARSGGRGETKVLLATFQGDVQKLLVRSDPGAHADISWMDGDPLLHCSKVGGGVSTDANPNISLLVVAASFRSI